MSELLKPLVIGPKSYKPIDPLACLEALEAENELLRRLCGKLCEKLDSIESDYADIGCSNLSGIKAAAILEFKEKLISDFMDDNNMIGMAFSDAQGGDQIFQRYADEYAENLTNKADK